MPNVHFSSKTDLWSTPQDFYEKLDEKERGIVDAAARTAIIAGRGLNRIIESSEKGLPALIEAGMEINTPTPEALQEFREVGLASSMEFIKETYKDEGVALAQMYLDAIEQAIKGGK